MLDRSYTRRKTHGDLTLACHSASAGDQTKLRSLSFCILSWESLLLRAFPRLKICFRFGDGFDGITTGCQIQIQFSLNGMPNVVFVGGEVLTVSQPRYLKLGRLRVRMNDREHDSTRRGGHIEHSMPNRWHLYGIHRSSIFVFLGFRIWKEGMGWKTNYPVSKHIAAFASAASSPVKFRNRPHTNPSSSRASTRSWLSLPFFAISLFVSTRSKIVARKPHVSCACRL